MNNIKLVLCYNGSAFYGSQYQPDVRTVESELLKAVNAVYGTPISLCMSGRTDSGVHASGQVCNLCVPGNIPIKNIPKALNRFLDKDIHVVSATPVLGSFNSRKHARWRVYRYLFADSYIPLYLSEMIVRVPFKVPMEYVNEITECFVGKHDFRHFRNLGSNETSTIRLIKSFNIKKQTIRNIYLDSDIVYYEAEIIGNSFLYRMVRNIMGAVFDVMAGKQPIMRLKKMLTSEKKTFLFTTAPAKGLSLVNVIYEE